MMDGGDVWAVLPVKELAGAKQRLSGVFSPEFRRALAAAMLSDVLAALAKTRGLSGILVITIDPDAAQLARGFGARISAQGATCGQTGAIEAATRALTAEGASAMLTIPGDVPGVTADELEILLQARSASPSFTIVPAHDRRGSNAVLCSPPDVAPLQFGNDSFLPHLDAARARGVEPAIIELERLGLDVDNPEDLFAFAQKGWRTETLSFLERSGFWTRR